MKNAINLKLLSRRVFLIIYDVLSVIAVSYFAILVRYELDWDAIPSKKISKIRLDY